MDAFLQDLKQAIRGITRSPGVAAAAIACFALGIGANVVMFGIVDALFLRAPAHVQAPEQVVRVYMQGGDPGEGTWVAAARSYPEYLSVAKQVPVGAGLVHDKGDDEHAAGKQEPGHHS